jgi:hypothetical protein
MLRFPRILFHRLLLLFFLLACRLSPAVTSSPTATAATPTATGQARVTPEPAQTPAPTHTATPVPTPFPPELVWFAPNMGSVDYKELLTNPESWSETRGRIDVFKFYGQLLVGDPGPCDICANNDLRSLVEAGVFRKLADWGIRIALEGAALVSGGCTSDIMTLSFKAGRGLRPAATTRCP